MRHVILTVYCIIAWTSLATAQVLRDPLLITSGPITGARVGDVRVYKGIPYAAPPVGALRWQLPAPPEPWETPAAMTRFRAICPQLPDGIFPEEQAEQSEDCLYLNVWTPTKDQKQRLPVMVWIHGGGLTSGSGSKAVYDGVRLAQRGVVVITFNYRLGAFGFFVHRQLAEENAQGILGNYGLHDQIAALRWVRDNAAVFGGDAQRVTIFGESAGAVSVLSLMASPLARGLFQRAIAQSGFAPARLQTINSAAAFWQARAKNIGIIDWQQALPALRARPAGDILAMYSGIGPLPGSSSAELLCCDGQLLPREPANVFADGEQIDVPLLIGSNADEGTIFTRKAAPITRQAYLRILRQLAPDHVDELLVFYPAATDAEVMEAYAALLGDSSFTAPSRRMARWHAGAGFQAYRYYFSRAPVWAQRAGLGAFHGAEVPYLFGGVQNIIYTRDDRALADTMANYWVAFASQGKPEIAGRPDWRPYHIAEDNYLALDRIVREQHALRAPACDLFDTLAAQR